MDAITAAADPGSDSDDAHAGTDTHVASGAKDSTAATISEQLERLINVVQALRNEPPKSRFEKIFKHFENGLTYTFKAGVLAVVLASLIYIVHEVFFRDMVLIEPFSVPKELSDVGLIPAVITEHVAAEIRRVLESETLSVKREFKLASEDSIPDIEVPEAKMSVKSLVSFVRTIFHRQPSTVNGAVIRAENAYLVKIYVNDGTQPVQWHVASFKQNSDINQLVTRSAYMVMRFTDPWSIGHYLLRRGDSFSRQELLDVIAANASCSFQNHQAAAANLQGSLFDRQGDHKRALASFEQAVTQDPRNPIFEIDHGWGLESVGRLKDALSAYKRAIRLGGDIPLAYNDVSSAYFNLKDMKNALIFVKKTLSLSNADSEARAIATWGWAEILASDEAAARKDKSKYLHEVESKFQEAVGLAPLGRIFVAWADFLLDKGDRERALKAYQNGCESRAATTEACLRAAAELAARNNSDYPLRYSCWARALKLETDNFGMTYFAIGAGEEAIGHLQHADADYRAAILLMHDQAEVDAVRGRLQELEKARPSLAGHSLAHRK